MRWALAEVPVKTIANHRLVAGLALLLAVEALLLLAGSFIPIEPLLHGWLVAFAIWSSVPIGSMALLMIHRRFQPMSRTGTSMRHRSGFGRLSRSAGGPCWGWLLPPGSAVACSPGSAWHFLG